MIPDQRCWVRVANAVVDCSFSSKKNFFKFRISPLVSGFVYISYLIFLLQLAHAQVTTNYCSCKQS
jgi:hypothetical protein